MSTENWHEERDRLLRLLQSMESGKVGPVSVSNRGQFRTMPAEDIPLLKKRLAQLNERLG